MKKMSAADSCSPDPMQANSVETNAVRYAGDETYRVMADAMPQIVWSAEPTGSRDYFNQRWNEHTRMNAAQTKGWGWVTALHKEDAARCLKAWKEAAQGQQTFEMEYRLICAEDGSYRWFIERAAPLFDPEGNVIKWFGSCTDVHDLKVAQAQIDELNVRLKRAMTETHHRVKNNLQIISAMVDIQLMNDQDMIPAEEFRRLGAHVQTLAAVHDLLTKELKDREPDQRISIRDVLQKLVPVHQQTAPACRIQPNIQDVRLPGRQGTSLALVINELISNAIKHGRGNVEVIVTEKDEITSVVVSDDGPGFIAGFDVKTAANTGLELVDNLVRWDLGGHVDFENQPSGGAHVSITIPNRHFTRT